MDQEKKKFNLTSDMINISGERTTEVIAPKQVMTNLTLRVPKEFVKEFKAWCAVREITMSYAIQQLFDKLKIKM
jgi:hypothetical protein